MWILGSKQKDLSFFYIIPLCISIFYWVIHPTSAFDILLFYFIIIFIDSAHVYTTIWRTYALKEERSAHSYYWTVPAIILGLSFLWLLLKVPYFWAFIVYYTYFHHLRQIQGLTKWYMKLNHSFKKFHVIILYLLLIVPFITFHFRPQTNLYLYNENDLLFFDIPKLFIAGMCLTVALWFIWVINEIYLYIKTKKFEYNRILSIFVPSAIHIQCFFFSNTLEGVIFPLLAIHGITYMAIMAHSMKILKRDIFSSFAKSFFLVFALGAFFAAIENLGLASLIDKNDSYLLHNDFLVKFLIALVMLPTLTHYTLDAFIWKKDHQGFRKILE